MIPPQFPASLSPSLYLSLTPSLCSLIPQLQKIAVGRATELLKHHSEHLALQALKAAGGEGNLEAVAEYARTLSEQKEQLVEVRTRRHGAMRAERVVSTPSAPLDTHTQVVFFPLSTHTHTFCSGRTLWSCLEVKGSPSHTFHTDRYR